jgi:hypothetical protein
VFAEQKPEPLVRPECLCETRLSKTTPVSPTLKVSSVFRLFRAWLRRALSSMRKPWQDQICSLNQKRSPLRQPMLFAVDVLALLLGSTKPAFWGLPIPGCFPRTDKNNCKPLILRLAGW